MNRKSILLMGVAAIGGAALALAVAQSGSSIRAPAYAGSATSDAAATPQSTEQIRLTFAPVARTVAPSVVNIYTARVVRERAQMGPFFSLFNSEPRVENALGSGVVVGAKGLIVTNNHVVDGADQIVVALPDRREFAAKVVFAEPRLDLALLQIDAKGGTLPVAHLGDSDRAEVGDLVLAIGNPFGVGQTVTQGIVSATARTGIGVSDAQFFIQTDASINRGNSGGALVNMSGEVIGINSEILTGSADSGSVGIGFAIPSNMVKIFLRGAASGKLVTAWIGVDGEALDAELAAKAGLARPDGVLVTGVTTGSPAAKAGIRAGDIIAALDGKRVPDPATLRYQIATHPVGANVTLSVVRQSKVQEMKVALAAPPETPPRDSTVLPGNSMLAGVTIANLSPALAQELGAGLPEHGVVVTRVPANSPAAQLGFPRTGDIVRAINGQQTATVAAVAGALRQGDPARTSMRLERSGQGVVCLFEAPGRVGCRAAQN